MKYLSKKDIREDIREGKLKGRLYVTERDKGAIKVLFALKIKPTFLNNGEKLIYSGYTKNF